MGGVNKKIRLLIVPWLFASILYISVYALVFGLRFVFDKLTIIENGFLIVSHSWYVFIQIVFYVIFAISVKAATYVDKYKRKTILLLSCLFTFILVTVIQFTKLGAWWYYSCYAFPVGISLKYYETSKKRSKKKDLLLAITALIAFVSFYILRYVNSLYLGSYTIAMISRLGASASFAFVIGIGSYYFRINTKLLFLLGKYSYDIFLIHILFIEVFRSSNIYISSNTLYILGVFATSLLCAFLLNVFLRKLNAKINYFLLGNKKCSNKTK